MVAEMRSSLLNTGGTLHLYVFIFSESPPPESCLDFPELSWVYSEACTPCQCYVMADSLMSHAAVFDVLEFDVLEFDIRRMGTF